VRKRFDRLGWKTERKATPLILVYGKRERKGEERGGGGGGDGRGEMERRGEGLRCESAHTGNFIEGNKRALRTEVSKTGVRARRRRTGAALHRALTTCAPERTQVHGSRCPASRSDGHPGHGILALRFEGERGARARAKTGLRGREAEIRNSLYMILRPFGPDERRACTSTVVAALLGARHPEMMSERSLRRETLGIQFSGLTPTRSRVQGSESGWRDPY